MPTAMPTPGRDADNTARTMRHSHLGRKGDLTVELHYGDFGDDRGRQAALYIWRDGHEREGVFVPLATMWMYGYTTQDQAAAFESLVPALTNQLYGGIITQSSLVRVMDAILEFLDDLRKSPPAPAMRQDRSLAAFLDGCEQEGLQFQVKINGDRVIN